MLIALLIVLGVNIIVVAAFAVIVFGRRRWVKRQPGEFAGAIRVSSGEIHGLSPKWKRGSGRWVRDVLVWTKRPLFFRNELIPIDGLTGTREAKPAEVKRLGATPVVVEFASEGATIEIAAAAEHRVLAAGRASAAQAASVAVNSSRSASGRFVTFSQVASTSLKP